MYRFLLELYNEKWKELHVQAWGILEKFSRFCLWKSNKYKDIGPKWGQWSKAQWDNLRGGNVNWGTTSAQGRKSRREGTTSAQGRRSRRERTAYNSKTRIDGNHSTNRGKAVTDVATWSGTIK